MLTELPYSKAPGLRPFLNEVRQRTADGVTIAMAAPYPTWEGGYDYCYARSLYILAGRRVVPLLDPQDRFHPEQLARAKYVAAYRTAPSFAGFVEVWRSADGALLKRQQ